MRLLHYYESDAFSDCGPAVDTSLDPCYWRTSVWTRRMSKGLPVPGQTLKRRGTGGVFSLADSQYAGDLQRAAAALDVHGEGAASHAASHTPRAAGARMCLLSPTPARVQGSTPIQMKQTHMAQTPRRPAIPYRSQASCKHQWAMCTLRRMRKRLVNQRSQKLKGNGLDFGLAGGDQEEGVGVGGEQTADFRQVQRGVQA